MREPHEHADGAFISTILRMPALEILGNRMFRPETSSRLSIVSTVAYGSWQTTWHVSLIATEVIERPERFGG